MICGVSLWDGVDRCDPHWNMVLKRLKPSIALRRNPSQSYGASLAIWDRDGLYKIWNISNLVRGELL